MAGGAETAEVVLSPTSATNEVGSSHTITAIVLDEDGDPVEGAEVTFVVEGATATTNSNGEATFTYTGVNEGRAIPSWPPRATRTLTSPPKLGTPSRSPSLRTEFRWPMLVLTRRCS